MCPERYFKTPSDRLACQLVGLFGKNQVGAGLGDHVYIIHPVMAADIFHHRFLYSPIYAIDGCRKSRHVPRFFDRVSSPGILPGHYSLLASRSVRVPTKMSLFSARVFSPKSASLSHLYAKLKSATWSSCAAPAPCAASDQLEARVPDVQAEARVRAPATVTPGPRARDRPLLMGRRNKPSMPTTFPADAAAGLPCSR